MAQIPLALIDTAGRLRPVDKDRALMIAAAMAEEGQRMPVEVRALNKRGRYPLISGGHRVAGAALLGWEHIEAEILDLTADEAREREINENLYRADLTELDKAVFLFEKKRLYEKKNPSAKHGGDHRSVQAAIFGRLIPSFTEEVSERLGLSDRTLRRVIARAGISEDARAKIAGTAIANNGSELDALLRLEPEEQVRVAQLIGSGTAGAPATVSAAVATLSGAAPAAPKDQTEAQHEALMVAWRRSPDRRARDRFLAYLASQGETLPTLDGDK